VQNVREIPEVENALRQIREEIDSIESILNFLQNSIQYSTISIHDFCF